MDTTTLMTLDKAPDSFLGEMTEHDPNMGNLWREVQRFREACSDAEAPTTALTMEPTPAGYEVLKAASGDAADAVFDRARLVAETPQGRFPMRVFKSAHNQIAERTKVPREYYARMLEEAPDLLSTNVNHWFEANPEQRLIRMIQPLDDVSTQRLAATGAAAAVRAFLGRTYKTIDHYGLLNHVLPIAFAAGAKVENFNIGETKFHVKLVTGQDQLQQFLDAELRNRLGEQFGRGHGPIFEELMQFGLSLGNSETGHGMVSIEPLAKVCRCTNLLIVVESKGIRHVGRKRGNGNGGQKSADEEYFQADTRALDDAATYLKVRDKVIEVFDRPAMEKVAGLIAERSGVEIPVPDDKPVMEFIGNIGKNFELTEQETSILQEEVTKEMALTQSGMTPWMLSQGMTATANRVKDYERGHDLQTTGWKVLNDPVEKLLKAGQEFRRKGTKDAN